MARTDGRIYMCRRLGLAPYIGKLRRGVLVHTNGLFARAAPRAALQVAPWVAPWVALRVA